MNKLFGTLFLLAPLALAACGTTIVNGGGTGGDGVGGGDGGGDVGTGVAAVAMTRAQNDAAWAAYWAANPPGSGSTTSSGGGGLNPNDLFLHVSDLGVSCSLPLTELSCGGHWDLTIVLPPAYQAVGVYDLEDPGLLQYSVLTSTGQPNGSGGDLDCSWGGGSIGSGSVEILSIDASEVRFRVNVVDPFDANPSGEYTALRCP